MKVLYLGSAMNFLRKASVVLRKEDDLMAGYVYTEIEHFIDILETYLEEQEEEKVSLQ